MFHSLVHAQSSDSNAKNAGVFLSEASKSLRWTDTVEPAKIAGPIFYVGTKGLAVFLITSAEGHILIYTGMPGSGPMIEASIRKLGFKPEDIKILLTGHAHVDHVGGHAYIKKISGAQVAMMEQEKELLESGGKKDFQYSEFSDFWYEPVKVDRVLQHGDTLRVGDVTLIGLHSPGHTKGGTTWVTNIQEGGKKYTVVFRESTSINPGYRLVKNPSYPGIAEDYRKTLQTLESLKPDIWLTSHPEVFDYSSKLVRSKTAGINAWIDPEGFRKTISAARAALEKQVREETAAVDGGK